MGPKTKLLIEDLGSLIKLLEEDDEDHWSVMIRKYRQRLLDSDYSGISCLLQMYGGMGSFNDLMLGQSNVNGAIEWKKNAKELNEQLDLLRTKVFKITEEIRYDYDSPAV